jgi:hypothetical protein
MAIRTWRIMGCPGLRVVMRTCVQYTLNLRNFNGVEVAAIFNHTSFAAWREKWTVSSNRSIAA